MTPKKQSMIVRLETVINRKIPKKKINERPDFEAQFEQDKRDRSHPEVKEIDKPICNINLNKLCNYAMLNVAEAKADPRYEEILKDTAHYMTFLLKVKKKRCKYFESFIINKILSESSLSMYENLYRNSSTRTTMASVLSEYVYLLNVGDKWEGLESSLDAFLNLPPENMTFANVHKLQMLMMVYKACAVQTEEYEFFKERLIQVIEKFRDTPVEFIRADGSENFFCETDVFFNLLTDSESSREMCSIGEKAEQAVIGLFIKIFKVYQLMALSTTHRPYRYMEFGGCFLVNYIKNVKFKIWPELWEAANRNIDEVAVPWLYMLAFQIKRGIDRQLIKKYCELISFVANASAERETRINQSVLYDTLVQVIKVIQDRDENIEKAIIDSEWEHVLDEYLNCIKDIKRNGYVLSK
jgi:hypothetical protein